MDIKTTKMDLPMRIRFHGAMLHMAIISCKALVDNNRRTMTELSTAVNLVNQLVELDNQTGQIARVNENQYLIDIQIKDLDEAWQAQLDRTPKFPGSSSINLRVTEAVDEGRKLSQAIKELQQETCGSK